MVKYTLRRLFQAFPTLFGITILSYLLMAAAPGGPVAAMTFGPRVTPAQREQLARRLGVNDPLPVQYLRWLIGDDWLVVDRDEEGQPIYGERKGILRGDFGVSFYARRPAMEVILERVPATLELGATSLFFGLVIGVPIGIIAAVRRGGRFDNFTRIMAVIFNAVPIFWLGLILILIFGSWLGILPMGSRCPSTLTGGCPPVYERMNYLILPTFVLAAGGVAGYSRYIRASMLDVIGQDYVRTARAKGLSPRTVWFRHAARNALIPLATFLGPAITGLLSGAAVTETIFSWPGLGRLAVSSVVQQDYPVVMAVVLVTSIATILGYVLSDILYAVIDPRIRFD